MRFTLCALILLAACDDAPSPAPPAAPPAPTATTPRPVAAPMEGAHAAQHGDVVGYACPMHADQTSTQPDQSCGTCGMKMNATPMAEGAAAPAAGMGMEGHEGAHAGEAHPDGSKQEGDGHGH